MQLAADAIRGQISAHSFATGPAMADPAKPEVRFQAGLQSPERTHTSNGSSVFCRWHRTLEITLGVDNNTGVVLKVDDESVFSAERLPLPHHDERMRCKQLTLFRICYKADYICVQAGTTGSGSTQSLSSTIMTPVSTQTMHNTRFEVRTFLPEVWFSLLHRAKAHIAGACARDAVQASTPSEHGENVEVLSPSIVCAVDHGRIAQTQGHAELGPSHRSFQLAHPDQLYATQQQGRSEKRDDHSQESCLHTMKALFQERAASSPNYRRTVCLLEGGCVSTHRMQQCCVRGTVLYTRVRIALEFCAWACVWIDLIPSTSRHPVEPFTGRPSFGDMYRPASGPEDVRKRFSTALRKQECQSITPI